jgi:hypothetical protein
MDYRGAFFREQSLVILYLLFESTHSSGAITITFKSGTGLTKLGFKSDFSCTALAVDDVEF